MAVPVTLALLMICGVSAAQELVMPVVPQKGTANDVTNPWRWVKEAVERDADDSKRNSCPQGNLCPKGTTADIKSGTKFQIGYFLVEAALGRHNTEPGSQDSQPVLLSLGLSSSLSWVQCEPCVTCFLQSKPIYNPKISPSESPVTCGEEACKSIRESTCNGKPANSPCQYVINYEDGTYSEGEIIRETLVLGNASVGNLPIGCGHINDGAIKGTSGAISLGRSPGNLAAFFKEFGGKFSYGLPQYTMANATGFLCMGPQCSLKNVDAVTNIVPTPTPSESYAVPLVSISVGTNNIGMKGGSDVGTPATVLDTATFISRLMPEVYEAVRDAFVKGTSASVKRADAEPNFDTCFAVDGLQISSMKGQFPTVTLNFPNGSVPLDVVATLAPIADRVSCFAFMPTRGPENNVIGSHQQQGLQIAFDVFGNTVAFGH